MGWDGREWVKREDNWKGGWGGLRRYGEKWVRWKGGKGVGVGYKEVRISSLIHNLLINATFPCIEDHSYDTGFTHFIMLYSLLLPCYYAATVV